MDIAIKKAGIEDFPGILALIKEFAFFQNTPGKVMITLEQMERDKELFLCLIAQTDKGVIVGFSSYFFAYYSWSGKALYLDDLYVTAEYRQQKIGARLLNTVIDLAKNEQCKKMRWQVSGWNKNAIEFYKSMGASIDDVEINCELDLTGREKNL